MSRDMMILNGTVRIVESSPTDEIYPPAFDPPDFSYIVESTWRALVGDPVEEETFESREAAFIALRGWKLDSN